uniref:Heat shock 70 kDa protein 12A n=1 Tax=Magallana gigas TaxID=29159 RepID=K1PQ01_MAGGI
MLLHENKVLHRDCKIKDMTGKPMRAMDVFALCIKYLKDTMIEAMKQKITFDIEDTNIDFVITVPAIWGDAAKLFMREAAINAGIKSDQLTLALEPEAASIYCQYLYMERKDEGNTDEFQKLVEGKAKYMVADLGGGTVDITVHKKADDGTLEELIPASGGPSGGTSVDKEYEKFLEKIGGEECTVIQKALREKFKSHRFIIPMEPGLAVLKGAVYFGHLPNAISRRVARFTYGVQICPKFKPGEHPENKKITVGDVARCKDVLHPFVKRGEQIKPGFEISTVCHSLKPQQGKIECGIYISDGENPKFVDEKGCRLLGKLTVTIPQGVYNAEIEEVIVFGETEITFRARQLESGKLFEAVFDMLDERFLPNP